VKYYSIYSDRNDKTLKTLIVRKDPKTPGWYTIIASANHIKGKGDGYILATSAGTFGTYIHLLKAAITQRC
jgi:hypothetical protein